jgi:hypothetical protein
VRVYLSGRGAQIPNLLEKLKAFLVEDLQHLPSSIEIEEEFLPAYVLAVQKDILVNLLPEQVKAREREAVYTKYARIAGVLLLSVLVVLTLNTLTNYSKLRSQVDSEKSLVQQKRDQLDKLAPIKSSLIYHELGPIVAEIERRDSSFIVLLKYLASRIPSDVYLREVEFNKNLPQEPPAPPPGPGKEAPKKPPEAGNNVQVKGYIFGDAETMEATLLRLMINLEKSGVVNNVTVLSKDVKELKGKPAMEFLISAKSVPYEI